MNGESNGKLGQPYFLDVKVCEKQEYTLSDRGDQIAYGVSL